MEYERIDAFEINYPESATTNNLKLFGSTGNGEKRIYIGHNQQELDEFFICNVDSCFFLKTDLKTYIEEAKEEYYNPSQEYKNDISKFYEDNLNNTLSISFETIKVKFSKTYDTQQRYYLVLEPQYKKEYDYARNIMLPRITRLRFVKIRNKQDNKVYIYIKPILQVFKQQNNNIEIIKENEIEKIEEIKQQRNRDVYKQQIYRTKLFEKMPCCIFTLCSYDRILNACHIKPYKVCEMEGKADE